VTANKYSIDGFDPLSITLTDSTEQKRLLEEQTKRFIQSILKSYTGFYDLFAELAQNGIDALERKLLSEKFLPKLWLTVDIDNSRVRFVDNGVGMSEGEFRSFLAPAVSFKSQGNSRGHKGVGATFLAYGYSYLSAQTKKGGFEIAAILRQGRQWAEDTSGTVIRPTFEGQPFAVPELAHETSGTAFEIIVGKSAGERPRDLGWIGATSPTQWFNVLRVKTPIGGVYLDTAKFRFDVTVTVIYNGQKTTETFTASEYLYPHEIEDFKAASIDDIAAALDKIPGDTATKFSKLPPEFKRLDAIYEVWNSEDLLEDESPFKQGFGDPEDATLIRKHRVSVYVCFLRSATLWTTFNADILKLRKNMRVIQGGLQMATDGMVQGELSVIPLTSAIGYQANTHVIVHFHDGNPDMGRKTFQPELKELADKLAVRSVTICRRYLTHLKPDTGNAAGSPNKALWDWKKAQELYRDKYPLSFITDGREVALVSEPQQEQDVVALFHELIGLGVIKGLKFLATSSHDTYDSLFICNYDERSSYLFNRTTRPLGVSEQVASNYVSEPKVLEYKYNFDSLLEEFDKELKAESHIDLVVCWTAGSRFKSRYYFSSLLIGDEGNGREIFGATHQAYRDGSTVKVFEVIVLSDLIAFLQNQEEEVARQKTFYTDA
jgi:hypothetical protein